MARVHMTRWVVEPIQQIEKSSEDRDGGNHT